MSASEHLYASCILCDPIRLYNEANVRTVSTGMYFNLLYTGLPSWLQLISPVVIRAVDMFRIAVNVLHSLVISVVRIGLLIF